MQIFNDIFQIFGILYCILLKDYCAERWNNIFLEKNSKSSKFAKLRRYFFDPAGNLYSKNYLKRSDGV